MKNKERINLTLSVDARENLSAIAQEWGVSLSDAMEIAVANEIKRLGLRRDPGVRTVDVEFDRATLSDPARRMLEIAQEQGVLVAESSVTIWDNDELGCDDTLRIRVRSLLSYEDRARRFGIAGLDLAHAERDAEGKPIWRTGEAGSPIPSEEYLVNLRRLYGASLDTPKTWEVPVEVVKQVRRGDLAGNDAVECIASEFWKWCADGAFEPI